MEIKKESRKFWKKPKILKKSQKFWKKKSKILEKKSQKPFSNFWRNSIYEFQLQKEILWKYSWCNILWENKQFFLSFWISLWPYINNGLKCAKKSENTFGWLITLYTFFSENFFWIKIETIVLFIFSSMFAKVFFQKK